MKKCRHPGNHGSVLSIVMFKNRSEHIEMRCAECGNNQGYLPRGIVEFEEIPRGTTSRQILIESGVEVVDGCFFCGGDYRGIDGFCWACRRKPEAKFIKERVRESGRKKSEIFKVSKPELYGWLKELEEQKFNSRACQTRQTE
jgi:hypothetical protein